jgi:hypothetical protein
VTYEKAAVPTLAAICAVCIVALTNFELNNKGVIGTLLILTGAFMDMMANIRRASRS